MNILAARIKSFIHRSRWLGDIMGSPYSAALHWVRIRFCPLATAKGKYGTYEFIFRGMDMPIVHEVIQNREYVFLKEEIGSIEQPVILDVGAHIGLFALCMLNINPKARILSVEAGPETFRLLRNNVQAANRDQWQAINRAAWSTSETIKFKGSGMSMSQSVSPNGSIEVTGITLPELLKHASGPKIDLMKVDIEGAEEAFLCFRPENLKKIERLVIELHREFCDAGKVLALLEKTYKNITYLTDRNSSRPLLYCHDLK